jgi:hypothetical protein
VSPINPGDDEPIATSSRCTHDSAPARETVASGTRGALKGLWGPNANDNPYAPITHRSG